MGTKIVNDERLRILKEINVVTQFIYFLSVGSPDSAVGIATGYELDHRVVGVRVPIGTRIFSISSIAILGLTQPPIQLVPWTLS
jgi:hypothetical protein